jgi:hypothetical protein
VGSWFQKIKKNTANPANPLSAGAAVSTKINEEDLFL